MRWAVVTGGGGDIGGAVCRKLAQAGWGVAIIDREAVRAEATCSAIRDSGGTATALTGDVADADEVREVMAAALALGDVRVLVNTAGKAHARSVFDLDYATWRADMASNLDSAFLCIHALQPHLIAGGGAIVSIASVNGMGAFGFPAYSTAKAGLIHLTRCLAVEYGRYDVRVNAVAPGTVRTRAWGPRLEANPALFDELQRLCPLPRVSEPDDVADAVLFLVSDAARMITGTVLTVDGGLVAGQPAAGVAVTQRK